MTLNLRRVDSFDVALPRQIEVAGATRCSCTPRIDKLGLINGQVLMVDGIAPDGALITREGVSVPAEFRQWCHGYVLTSHKAQGWTADHVVVAAERFTAKGVYVACSVAANLARCTRRIKPAPWKDCRKAIATRHWMCCVKPLRSGAVLSRVEAWKQLTARTVRRIVRQIAGSPPIRQDRGIKM